MRSTIVSFIALVNKMARVPFRTPEYPAMAALQSAKARMVSGKGGAKRWGPDLPIPESLEYNGLNR
jgi:hypothetical protein